MPAIRVVVTADACPSPVVVLVLCRYTPTAAVSKGTVPAEDIACNGTIEEEPAELPVGDQVRSCPSSAPPAQIVTKWSQPIHDHNNHLYGCQLPISTLRPCSQSQASLSHERLGQMSGVNY